MARLQVRCTTLVESQHLQRSSHTVNVVGDEAFVFGGELLPRQPRDNDVFRIMCQADVDKVETIKSQSSAPSPRVGAATAVLGGKIYLFSGRGGIDMAPVEEHGALWVFDPTTQDWTKVLPADKSAPYPPARSYHCATSDEKDHVYIHAGCPASGRLQDLWSFNIDSRTWQALPDAPGTPRGGASIAHVHARLYRMNGFDGSTEQGGSVDVFDLREKRWMSDEFVADGQQGPAARSVGVLLPLYVDNKSYLVTAFGEGDPSALGHAGAGKMFGDIWAYDLEAKTWGAVQVVGDEQPRPRGWFSADVMHGTTLIVSGGLDESNTRLKDIWSLSFSIFA